MSWLVEVSTGGDSWSHNGLRFDSEMNATDYAEDLFSRWTAVQAYRVVDSFDAATHSLDVTGRPVAIVDERPAPGPACDEHKPR